MSANLNDGIFVSANEFYIECHEVNSVYTLSQSIKKLVIFFVKTTDSNWQESNGKYGIEYGFM